MTLSLDSFKKKVAQNEKILDVAVSDFSKKNAAQQQTLDKLVVTGDAMEEVAKAVIKSITNLQDRVTALEEGECLAEQNYTVDTDSITGFCQA